LEFEEDVNTRTGEFHERKENFLDRQGFLLVDFVRALHI
jgi:hypothetical protein